MKLENKIITANKESSIYEFVDVNKRNTLGRLRDGIELKDISEVLINMSSIVQSRILLRY